MIYTRQMKQWLLLMLLVFFLFLAGCNEQTETTIKKIVHKTWEVPVTDVMVDKLPINYNTTGSVVSDQRIDIASRTTGYIRKIVVREGETVTKGQVLIILDEADIEGAIRQAQATVNKVTSSLHDAKTDLNHYKKLFKRGSVSESKLRKIQLHHDVAIDTLSEAQAALSTALSQRQYIHISSPITGLAVTRHKREGDLATPGTPILTIESNQSLLFETFVAESRIGTIRQGDTVPVSIDALNEKLKGVVARVVPAGDPLTRRYQVKIALPQHEGLLSGMFGRAQFHIGFESVPVISPLALTERGGLKGVFVVNNNNQIHFRWLQLGQLWDKQIEVRAGLKEGERILALADAAMREGDLVRAEDMVNE